MNELLDAFAVDCRERSVLVSCDDAERFAERLPSERGAARVDVLALGAPVPPELEERTYDLALVGDVLYALSPTPVHDAFRWVRDHLGPGAECLVETRTYLGEDGGGLGGRLRTPYAHLAFARDAIEEYYAGEGWRAPMLANPMCRATYFVLFRRAGLAIEDVQVEEEQPQLFADKLRWYDEDELRCSRFRARLRRSSEQQGALSELDATLKAP